jgi:hypothetical protein
MRIFTRVVIDLGTCAVIEADSYEYDGPVELARGENQKAWNQAQIAKSKAGLEAGQGYGAAATGERGYLLPQYQNIAANPMSAEERAGRLSAAGGAYDAAAQSAGERTARTGNTAGYGELLDELARGRSREMGTTASQLDTEAYNRKMAALKGVQGLYGTDVGAQTSLLRPEQPVKENSFWDDLILQLTGNAAKAGSMGLAG